MSKKAKLVSVEIVESDSGESRVLRTFDDGSISDEPLPAPKRPQRKPRRPLGVVRIDRTRRKRF